MSRAFAIVPVLLAATALSGEARTALPGPAPVPGVVDHVVSVVTSAVAPSPGSSSSSSSSPSPSAGGRATSVSRASELEAPLLTRINAVRRRFGLRPLVRSVQLTQAAVAHAQALAAAGYFSHNWSNGAPFQRWIRSFYPVAHAAFWSTGENLLWGSQAITPADAVDAWLASPEHRRNLLAPKWRQIGIGVVRVGAAPGFYRGQDVAIAATEFGVRR